MALNPAERLMSVAFPAPQAKEIARQIADAGGGGVVDSVNGQTGTVVLAAADVGAVAVPDTPPAYSVDPADLAAALVAAGLMEAE